MSKLIIAGSFLLVVLLSIPAGAAGKITVDPNAGSAVAEEVQPGADVAQKVTYEARRKCVASILADLSTMTGVTLKAGYNNEDWQVRDRKMNIFAKDIPLSNLMNSIARVMKFKWSKNEDTGSYQLYMDRKTLLGAERQRYLEEDKLRQRQTEARKNLISDIEEAAGMSDSDLETLKAQSPYIYELIKSGCVKDLMQLCSAFPAAREAFVAGEEYTANYDTLLSIVQKKQNGAQLPYQNIPNVLNKGSITINSGRSSWGSGFSASNIADITVKFSADVQVSSQQATVEQQTLSLQISFFDPGSNSAKFIATPYTVDTPEEGKRIRSEWNKKMALAGELDSKDLGEPLIEHLDDPTLSLKTKMNVTDAGFADALAAMAKASGLAVVSDSFDAKSSGLDFPSEEIAVRAVLDKLESVCRYNWERHDSTIELHDRDWFRKRAAQIPEAWSEAWRKAFKENGCLDLSELSQIAALTPEQFRVNISSDEVLGSIRLDDLFTRSGDILNVYASLNRQQQTLIFTKEGLGLDSLANHHARAIQTLMQRCPAGQAGLRLTCKKEKNDKQVAYHFKVVNSSGERVGLNWIIRCPVYNPPTQEKPEDSKTKQANEQGTKH